MRAIVNKYCGVFVGMGVMALVSSALIGMVMPQSAEAQVCAAVRGAHGPVVKNRKCVKTADIGNNQITSRKLRASIVIGRGNEDGSLSVRRIGGPGQLMFEVDPVNDVRIGRGGDATTQRSDTDLYVFDPNFTQSATEPALFFNASLADLRLGSGNSTNSGDDGDIVLEDAVGRTSISISGGGASMNLGTGSNAGDLGVRNGANQLTFNVQGSNGDVTNILSGDGLVKAWARINGNGTIESCWRCNTDTAQTRRISTGLYEVDFTPLGNDIQSRPRLAVNDFFGPAAGVSTQVDVSVGSAGADLSSIWVRVEDTNVQADRPFTLVVF